MTLGDLSSITTAISAVAILASLVFVNIPVSQTEKYQRASIQQERASRTADIAMHLMDPHFIELRQFLGYCR